MHNPQWLRSFAAVVAHGGFTRAAQQLGLTQAAVSQHVRHLEDELGPLLIRRPRQVELTPAGTALLAFIQDMERAQGRLRASLSQTVSDQGEVSLISPGSVGLALYPILLDYQRNHPGLMIRHRFAPDPEALQAVVNKQYELGLVTMKPDDPRVAASAFTEEVLELVVPAGAQAEDWADLQRLGFIDHPDGRAMATRLLSRRFPGNPGVGSLPVHGFTNQVALILEPVSRGLGFTVIPRHARESFAQPALIDTVECGDPVRDTLWLIHRAEWPLSGAAQWLVERLRGLPRFRRDRAT
ncbi:LysR family transcriptional regulator [Stenotrophomonas sp. YAU14D1_LEIMI4_1]|uniref:LysR family transcriptional regulator n=1 Tax=Stenotrophomonas sp. YAU14D1_LEIMI4_1 TaxID=2072407 RepID=UPI000D53D5D5|nr:LysR family transcriptional regulator [Stenotrophomonas sp. YAU14D1_LEIMI4_1]AWH26667.1 LysR family transcriptional regulator [Stenotrophomonas sp. YAU14D1_LEIMI4_1]